MGLLPNYPAPLSAPRTCLDPFPQVADPSASFAMALQAFSNQNPGRVVPLVQEALKNDVKVAQAFEARDRLVTWASRASIWDAPI